MRATEEHMEQETAERSYVIEGKYDLEQARVAFGVEHMADNMAYVHAARRAGGDADGSLLRAFRDRFAWYRESWRALPARSVAESRHGERFRELDYPPLCVDLETAAVCDLACPFCFRQFIATPDKVMSFELYRDIVDQCAELGVPSIKLNWRGEPLLHPKLPEMVDYAKRAGILEVLMNTNATTLDARKSAALVEAGLDMLIYSFDGATKDTYEKMRPGRFRENGFEAVLENIRGFAAVRASMGKPFPRTRIQMVLTNETIGERDRFFELFEDCVDDVSVKAYTERGGRLEELGAGRAEAFRSELDRLGLPAETPFWQDIHGRVFVSTGRLPCEQPFQRLLVTYDGRVSMCCYDWGSQYPIGYVSEAALANGEREARKVHDKAKAGAKGFELMPEVEMPAVYNEPPAVVSSLRELWHGSQIDAVRRCHVEGRGGEVNVCERCTFKETYRWHELLPA